MATKKKTEVKLEEPKWYVEELLTGQKKYYVAAKKLGDSIVTRGGYWETHKDAQEVADMLNKEGK
jgi:hypothetical protein